MQLFYQPHFDQSHKNIFFDAQESKHIVKVLRKQNGDILWITNGNGLAAKAELFQVNQKKCEAVILDFDHQENLIIIYTLPLHRQNQMIALRLFSKKQPRLVFMKSRHF